VTCPNPSSSKEQSVEIFVSFTLQEAGVKVGETFGRAHFCSSAGARQKQKKTHSTLILWKGISGDTGITTHFYSALDRGTHSVYYVQPSC